MFKPPHRRCGSDLTQASPWEWESPSRAGVSQQTGCAWGDCSHHSHVGQGPHCGHYCANGGFSCSSRDATHQFHRLLAAGSCSWMAAFAQCCTPAINPAPESRHTGSCFPDPCSGSSLSPVHSALVSQYPWDKGLTHSRESFRIQTRHKK